MQGREWWLQSAVASGGDTPGADGWAGAIQNTGREKGISGRRRWERLTFLCISWDVDPFPWWVGHLETLMGWSWNPRMNLNVWVLKKEQLISAGCQYGLTLSPRSCWEGMEWSNSVSEEQLRMEWAGVCKEGNYSDFHSSRFSDLNNLTFCCIAISGKYVFVPVSNWHIMDEAIRLAWA